VLLADDLDAAFAVWGNALHPVTVVTLAGESIDASGTVTGGSEPPLEETLLARERELRELERLLAENAARVADVDHALQQARATGTALDDALAEVGRRLQAIGLEQLSLEKDRERLEEERCRITAELEAGALEATGLAGTGGEVTAELSALQQRSVRAERAVVERREELAARQAALAAWRERYAAGEQRRTTAAVHAAAVAERSRALQGEEQQARAGIEELTGRFQEAERAERAAGDGTRLAATEVTEADGVRAAAEVRIEVLALERRELRAAIQQADSTLTADDVRERQARERFDTLRDERSRLEGELTERRIGLEHLATQLAERYELTLATLGEVSLEEGGGDDEAARVEMLRARLGQLGDVNPGALHELEEVRGRHEFLVAQRADLEQSLDDLRRTIARLVRTSRQRFDETFAAANERLAEVFPKLFPDGKARLELITPEGAGEAGVEIVVQPFGKKLQSLSLLSGGEKALTATALVLSLFLIRPTPFCLLDEVDAPLDEANIGRFNQIVREMAERTQFVLITHNRRTMEAADTLYGITMERPGVSKVVSVRLREAA
jgi:chromosome segregation protein